MIGDLETPGDLSAEKVGVGGGTVRCQGNLPSRSLGKEKKKEGGFSALSERNHRRSCTSRADNGLKKKIPCFHLLFQDAGFSTMERSTQIVTWRRAIASSTNDGPLLFGVLLTLHHKT